MVWQHIHINLTCAVWLMPILALIGPFPGVLLVLDHVSKVVDHRLTGIMEREVALLKADLSVAVDVRCFQHPLQFTNVDL